MRTLRWRKPETWIVRRATPRDALLRKIPMQGILLTFAILAFAPVQQQIHTGTFHWSDGNAIRIGSVIAYIAVGATLAFYTGAVKRTEASFHDPAAEAELAAADQAVARYSLQRTRLSNVAAWHRAEYAAALDRAFREYVEGLYGLAAARVSIRKWTDRAAEDTGLSAFARDLIAPTAITEHEEHVAAVADAFDHACTRIASAAEH